MTGVEILATQEIITEFAFNWNAFWITFSVTFGMFALLGFFLSLTSYKWSNLCFCIIVGSIMGLFVGCVVGDQILCTPTTYETQYKVTISDEVSMNEFLEKYEIIDQEGKILTVRERSVEEDLQ